jgi:hypothetical protein
MNPNPLPMHPGDFFDESNTWVVVTNTKSTPSIWDDEIVGKGFYRSADIDLKSGKETVTVFDLYLNKEVTIDHSDDNINVLLERIKTQDEKLKLELIERCLSDKTFSEEQKKKVYYSSFTKLQHMLTLYDITLELKDGTMNKFSQASTEWGNTKLAKLNAIYPGAEKYNYKPIIKKFIEFINKVKLQKISEIETLVSEETDKEIVAEYKSLIIEIKEDADLFIKEILTGKNIENPFVAFGAVTYSWPTLLNPSPFHT